MPGKQKRAKEPPLSRPMSKLAGQLVKPHFDPAKGEQQFDDIGKVQVVAMVNAGFVERGWQPLYTVRKLEDWVSNSIYRWRVSQRPASDKPASWAQRAKYQETEKLKRKRTLSNVTLKPQTQLPRREGDAAVVSKPAGVRREPEPAAESMMLNVLSHWHAAPAPLSPAQEHWHEGVKLVRERTLSERSLRLAAEQSERACRSRSTSLELETAEVEQEIADVKAEMDVERSTSQGLFTHHMTNGRIVRGGGKGSNSSLRSLGSLGSLGDMGNLLEASSLDDPLDMNATELPLIPSPETDAAGLRGEADFPLFSADSNLDNMPLGDDGGWTNPSKTMSGMSFGAGSAGSAGCASGGGGRPARWGVPTLKSEVGSPDDDEGPYMPSPDYPLPPPDSPSSRDFLGQLWL